MWVKSNSPFVPTSLRHSLWHQSLKSVASARWEKTWEKKGQLTIYVMKGSKVQHALPEWLFMASLFPFREAWAEAGEDERDRSAGLPTTDFCRLNDPAEVPLTGVLFITLLPWLARWGKSTLLMKTTMTNTSHHTSILIMWKRNEYGILSIW